MRIAVLGPGAVGGLLAARLGHAGHDITVVATEQTSAAIAARGIELRTPEETLAIRPGTGAWLTGPVDVLFVAVKATELLPALARVPAGLVGGAVVVPLLNGIDHMPLLRAMYPAATVVAATIAVEATRIRPGVIEQTSGFADFAVTTAQEPGRQVADMLTAAGLAVRTNDDERLVLWRKLAMLAPLALLTTSARAPLGEALRARADWVRPLVAETVAAAGRGGATIDVEAPYKRLLALPDTMRSSMLKDFTSGRALELDAIAGPVIRALTPEQAVVTSAAVEQILENLAAR
jgi:2-dehydropantoate 2-reductase